MWYEQNCRNVMFSHTHGRYLSFHIFSDGVHMAKGVGMFGISREGSPTPWIWDLSRMDMLRRMVYLGWACPEGGLYFLFNFVGYPPARHGGRYVNRCGYIQDVYVQGNSMREGTHHIPGMGYIGILLANGWYISYCNVFMFQHYTFMVITCFIMDNFSTIIFAIYTII